MVFAHSGAVDDFAGVYALYRMGLQAEFLQCTTQRTKG
jgi:hypothetical protein